MRRLVAVALAAGALAGCGGRSKIGYPTFGDPTRFKRIGVLPFSGSGGAERVADLLVAGMSRKGLSAPAPAELEKVFEELKLKRSTELSIAQLVEVRGRTGVEALLFGHVSGGGREASLIMLDTDLGDVAMEARLRPARGRRFSGPEAIAASALNALLREPKSVDGVELPKD